MKPYEVEFEIKKARCKDCYYNKDGRCELYEVALPLNGECYNW